MVSTSERPTGGKARPSEQTPGPNRLTSIVIATLAALVVVLGITVIYQASDDDGSAAGVFGFDLFHRS